MELQRSIPRRRVVLFVALAAGGLALDLATKHWMFRQPDLRAGGVRWLWPEHVGLQLSLNEGALFGMGQGRVWIFAACSLAAAAAIPLWLFVFRAARDWRLNATLGAIWGGVAGNLYDRVGLPGMTWTDFDPARAGERVHAVRDFVLLAWAWDPQGRGSVVWPNFNLADSLLVGGAALLVLISLRPEHDSATTNMVGERASA